MVASDTVVGIVGAVLLVAVMAGVFAYEYTHAGTQTDMQGGGTHDYSKLYPRLNASQDIDGDHVANGQDSDIDGDGIDNANDTVVMVNVPISGASPAVPQAPGGLPLPGGPSGVIFRSPPFMVGTGADILNGSVSYDSATPAGVPASPGLSFALIDPKGQTIPGDCGTVGNTVGCTFKVGASDLTVGNYVLEVTQDTPGPQVTFAGALHVHYDTSSTAVPMAH